MYTTINYPNHDFRRMSSKEAQVYFEWFKQQIPERISELFTYVNKTITPPLEISSKPEGLTELGHWFIQDLSEDEKDTGKLQYNIIQTDKGVDIPVLESNLSNIHRSLAIDIGVYLGHIMIVVSENSIKWELAKKKQGNHNEPILIGFKSDYECNPVMDVLRLCHKMSWGQSDASAFHDYYKLWTGLV